MLDPFVVAIGLLIFLGCFGCLCAVQRPLLLQPREARLAVTVLLIRFEFESHLF